MKNNKSELELKIHKVKGETKTQEKQHMFETDLNNLFVIRSYGANLWEARYMIYIFSIIYTLSVI